MAYDEDRDLYVAVNAGIAQDIIPNDGYISLINPDGSAHTLKWIGVDRNGLTLNHPLGSDIINGLLYVADINVVRWFDMGAASRAAASPSRTRNASTTSRSPRTGPSGPRRPGRRRAARGRVPDRTGRRLVGRRRGSAAGPAQRRGLRPGRHIVVVNIGDNAVLTFSPDGELVRTEHAVDGGNDGLVILDDGTKYVSSVRIGTVSRIRPGEEAEVVASGIPSAASMAYDSKRNRLLIPMNNWNAITIVELD